MWEAIAPLLQVLADDPARLAGVAVLGVDEHIWHHAPRPGKGPKELTGMVDLTKRPDVHGKVRTQARLLDLVPGRSGPAYAGWLSSCGPGFTDGVKVATLDPFQAGRANNGGTEAVNGIIELHRRLARGFRNPSNYRLRIILAAGKFTHPNLR